MTDEGKLRAALMSILWGALELDNKPHRLFSSLRSAALKSPELGLKLTESSIKEIVKLCDIGYNHAYQIDWFEDESHECQWCPHAKTGEGVG